MSRGRLGLIVGAVALSVMSFGAGLFIGSRWTFGSMYRSLETGSHGNFSLLVDMLVLDPIPDAPLDPASARPAVRLPLEGEEEERHSVTGNDGV